MSVNETDSIRNIEVMIDELHGTSENKGLKSST
jgi:hypothetical protein